MKYLPMLFFTVIVLGCGQKNAPTGYLPNANDNQTQTLILKDMSLEKSEQRESSTESFIVPDDYVIMLSKHPSHRAGEVRILIGTIKIWNTLTGEEYEYMIHYGLGCANASGFIAFNGYENPGNANVVPPKLIGLPVGTPVTIYYEYIVLPQTANVPYH